MYDKARLEDVARVAGVSARTVARVVNDLPNVSAKARASVERAISGLDYRPNLAARALASARSPFIGIASANAPSSYFYELHAALITACRGAGLHPVFELTPPVLDDFTAHLRQAVREVSFGGLILLPECWQAPGLLDFLEQQNIPCVALGWDAPTPPCIGVDSDRAAGEAALADHLWDLGHRRFAVAKLIGNVALTRGPAFRRRLIERGAEPDLIRDFPLDWHLPALEAGRRLAEIVTKSDLEPTALFTLNDEVSAGAIGHFLSQGVRVPEDISVAGFDDSPIANACWPPLTTVRQPIEAMAREAVRLVSDKAQVVPGRRVTLPVELVVRASTGPAQAR